MAALRKIAPAAAGGFQGFEFSLHRKLLDRINLEALSDMAGARVRNEDRAAVARLVEEERTPLSLVEKERLMEEVLDEVFGLGPLEPLLEDPTISDIPVTTPRLVYVERGGKLFRTTVEFEDNAHLLRVIEKVVSRVGRRVDESSPLVDARLPDGSARAIRQQVASAVDETSRFSDGSRRVTHITEVVGMEGDIITLQEVYVFEKLGLTPDGKVKGHFRATGIRPRFYERVAACGRVLPPGIFQHSIEVN